MPGRCRKDPPPDSSLLEHLLEDFLWVNKGGEADPDQQLGSYRMKLQVRISGPTLRNGTQHHCSGFGNLPNLRSPPAVTESSPQPLRLLMGTSVPVAHVMVTGRTQQREEHLTASSGLQSAYGTGGNTQTAHKHWELMG